MIYGVIELEMMVRGSNTSEPCVNSTSAVATFPSSSFPIIVTVLMVIFIVVVVVVVVVVIVVGPEIFMVLQIPIPVPVPSTLVSSKCGQMKDFD